MPEKILTMNVKQLIGKLFLVVVFVYLVVVVGAMLIAATTTEKAFIPLIRSALHDNNCENQYPRKSFNPLFPINAYLESDYFSADYRVSEKLYKEDRCLVVIREALAAYKRSTKVAVVDKNSDVIVIIRTVKGEK
jgi:hypothetical protein